MLGVSPARERAHGDRRAPGVVDERGQTYEVKDLYMADGSILPTSIGVNSQVPIMAMATHLAWRLADNSPAYVRGPRRL